jgi:hypothetical protein
MREALMMMVRSVAIGVVCCTSRSYAQVLLAAGGRDTSSHAFFSIITTFHFQRIGS